MNIIEIKGITKYYGDVKALDNVTFTMEMGKIYGLLGRNGAGKTTLLNLITNRIFPTEGEISIDGGSVYENDKMLRNIFYMTEKNLYPGDEKLKNIFKWTRQFYPSFDIDYAKGLAEKFGLNINKEVKDLSTGYTSIFKAVAALASNTGIIIFDEPILGLDANHRDMLYKEMLANYNHNPRTVIISTHLIEEVAQVLEEVVIIKEGKLVLKQSVEDLLSGAYCVTGEASKVDRYIEDRKHVGDEKIGNIKTVIVLEDIRNKDKVLAGELELELSGVQLQKLFIALTN